MGRDMAAFCPPQGSQEPVLSPERTAKLQREKQRIQEYLYISGQSPGQLKEPLWDFEWINGLVSLPGHELVELINYLDAVGFISMLTEPCSPTP